MTTKERLMEKYAYAKAVNFEGIEIHAVNECEDTEDKAFGIDGTDIFLVKVHYDTEQPYIVVKNRRYRLDGFYRV